MEDGYPSASTNTADEGVRRAKILEQANAACGMLRSDPVAWRELQAEGADWDGARADDIDDE